MRTWTVAILLLLFAIGCGKGNKLVGVWTPEGNTGTEFQFNSDNSFSIKASGSGANVEMSGNYSLSGDNLTMTTTALKMTATDPKMQAQVSSIEEATKGELNKPQTVPITWKSDDQFSLAAPPGIAGPSGNAKPVMFTRKK